MIDAFVEIRSAAGLPTDLTPVGSALPLAAAAG
jgi:diacylglycerol O-acyltransferase / wax synthase